MVVFYPSVRLEVPMTKAWLGSAATALTLALAVTPALACERHQQHVGITAQEVASTATAAEPISAPLAAPATVVVTPTAATEAPQSVPVKLYGGRNCNYNRTTQALTQ
jgi:hypothetical protein